MIAISAVLTVSLVIAALARYSSTRSRIEWGSLPNWLTVAAAFFALAGIVVAYQSLKTTLRHRRDDEANQARLLLYSTQVILIRGAGMSSRYLQLRFMNASSAPFHLLNVVGATYNGKPCYQTVVVKIRESEDPSFTSLPAGEIVESTWGLPAGATGHEEVHAVTVRYTYLDNNGRQWDRLGNTAPQRVYGEGPSDELISRFKTAMATAPKDSCSDGSPLPADPPATA